MLSHEGRKPPQKTRKSKNNSRQGVPVADRLRQAKSFQERLDQGMSRADIARARGVTRARVTQVMKLLDLSPLLQAYILAEKERKTVLTERAVRPLLSLPWESQEQWAAESLPEFEFRDRGT